MSPRARSSDDDAVRAVAHVELRADGTTWLNGLVMRDDSALTEAVRADVRKEPHVVAEIVADPAVPYARVIHAIDLLRVAGISDVALGSLVPKPVPAP